jgi:hypothetical protein
MAPRLVSHTFAALLVDEDFVLITATNKTLVAQRTNGAAKAAAQWNRSAKISRVAQGASLVKRGGGRGSVAGLFSA